MSKSARGVAWHVKCIIGKIIIAPPCNQTKNSVDPGLYSSESPGSQKPQSNINHICDRNNHGNLPQDSAEPRMSFLG